MTPSDSNVLQSHLIDQLPPHAGGRALGQLCEAVGVDLQKAQLAGDCSLPAGVSTPAISRHAMMLMAGRMSPVPKQRSARAVADDLPSFSSRWTT